MCWLIPFLTGLIFGILAYMLLRSLFGGSSSNDDRSSNDHLRGSAAYGGSGSSVATSSLAAGSVDASASTESAWDKTKDVAEDVKDAVVDAAEDVVDGAKELASDASTAVSAGAASVAAGLGLNLVDFDADAAKAVFGKRVKLDDLTFVEGIGPKIAELFHNQGVKTWADLAVCSVERCQEVLNTGGDRFAIHNPGTWPRQAKMAAQGQWQELFDWQEKLDGGKE